MSVLDGIKHVKDLDLKGKRVFLRLDLNVPIKNGKIKDETRIQAALPTIKHCIEAGAKLVVASHLGRPKGPADRGDNSLEPVAQRLGELLNLEVELIEDPASDAPKMLLSGIRKSHNLILLENLRFDPGEEKNSEELAAVWAEYTDVYVNDAFGASHRAHASISALPHVLSQKPGTQKGAGFLMYKEIEMLSTLLDGAESPYLAILGGAKVSDKIPVIENLMDKVDGFIVGGAMAYTFLAAKKTPVGKSRVEKEQLTFARQLIERVEARDKKIMLPVDHIIGTSLEDTKPQTTSDDAISDDYMGLDIGPKTLAIFNQEIARAKTIFWNGPMGVFENSIYSKGTFGVAAALAESSGKTIVGGGDSAAAVNASGFSDKMTHISTGGGASLEFLEGKKLPGLESLRPKRY